MPIDYAMRSFFTALDRFFMNRRNLYLLGFLLTFGLSFSEVMRGKQFNFMIFSDATLDFWRGIVPYGSDWAAAHHDYYLYGPLFNLLFTPFALLPAWLGPFVWNLFNYTLYFLAIFTLPERYTVRQKRNMYLYTMLILATTQLSFQYNVAVAYLFVFAFSLLERGRAGWAIALILISGFTKVYGVFQLGLLLCYPRFWRNMGYVLGIALLYFLLPMVKIPAESLLDYYRAWIDGLNVHYGTRVFETFFNIRVLFPTLPSYMHYVQGGILIVLAGLLGACRRRWSDPAFRAQALGILMGYVILFSNSVEKHTYVIALLGYLIWYGSRIPRFWDKWLYWANFVVLVWMPVDLLFPVRWMHFFFDTLDLNQWLFLVTWLRMVWITLGPRRIAWREG